jgi:hypothetical protein
LSAVVNAAENQVGPVKSLKDYYDVPSAAREIGIDHMALRMRIHRGTVKAERPFTRVVLIPKKEVERLKKEKEQAE